MNLPLVGTGRQVKLNFADSFRALIGKQGGENVDEKQLIPSLSMLMGYDATGPKVWTWESLVAAYKSWVYIATDKIAKTVATIPLNLFVYKNARTGKFVSPSAIRVKMKQLDTAYEKRMWLKANDIEKVMVEQHPFLDLLRMPNHITTRYSLWYDTMIKMELGGSCGWYLPPNRMGLPGEIWALPLTSTAKLSPIPDTERIIRGYLYQDGDLKTEFTVEEMLWMRYPSPESPLKGMSPLKAQTYPYCIDEYLEQFEYYMLKNRAVPGLNLHTDKDMTQKEQIEAIKAQIVADFGGVKKAGGLFVTHSGFKIGNPINQPLKDLMIKEIEGSQRDKLLSAYDVPAGIVGLIDDVNRATMEVLAETFMMSAIKPRLMLIEEYLEAFVLPRYDQNLTADFDIPEYSQRELDLKERQQNLSTGYTTINEERTKEGKDEVEWGEKPWLPFGLRQPSEEEPTPTPPPTPNPNPDDDDDDDDDDTKSIFKLLTAASWTKERKEAQWQAFLQLQQKWEAILTETAQQMFKGQRERVLAKFTQEIPKWYGMSNGWSRKKRATWIKANDGTTRYNVNKKDEQAAMIALFAPVYRSMVEEVGTARAQSVLGLRMQKQQADAIVLFNVSDPSVEKWIGARLDKFSKKVTGTTFDTIKAVLREGFEEGAPMSTVSQALAEKFADFERYRAPAISRTESTGACNYADLEGVKQSGLEKKLKKFWIDSMDATTRDTHHEAGQKYSPENAIPINENFQVGADSMAAPGLGSTAEEVVNCRCTVGYVEA